MPFAKTRNKLKVWLSGIGGTILLFLTSTNVTHASAASTVVQAISGLVGINDIAAGMVEMIAFVISYTMAFLAGIAVAIEAWLIGVILYLSDSIFQTVFIQSGFSISLSIANLAFVAGIIVIAIATIIRSESYGIKKLLWKLVAAAILVNFGLVIAAPIFGVANSFTHYFLNCISPNAAGGGCSQNVSGFNSFDVFATTFAGAFQPQNGLASVSNGTTIKDLSGAFTIGGADFGKTLAALVGIVFTFINLLLIVIVLGGFMIMLLVRYIYIAILAVLMPFAWAAWVFPGFQKHWSKWWDKFLKWTFFAPLALFFIYLAMLLMQTANGNTGAGALNLAQFSNGGAFTAIKGYATGLLTPLMTSLLQEIIFAGLIVGGLFAAEKMGLEGAKAVRGAAKGAAKAGTAWVGKRGTAAGLRLASRISEPRVKTSANGGKYMDLTRRNRLRGTLSSKLRDLSESGSLDTKGKGFMDVVYKGAKDGSGLFKKKRRKGEHGDGDHDGGGGGGGRGGGGSSGNQSSGGSGAAAAPPSSGHGGGAHAQATTQEQAAANLDALGFGGGAATATVPTPVPTATDNRAAAVAEVNNLQESAAKLRAAEQMDLASGGGNAAAAPVSTAFIDNETMRRRADNAVIDANQKQFAKRMRKDDVPEEILRNNPFANQWKEGSAQAAATGAGNVTPIDSSKNYGNNIPKPPTPPGGNTGNGHNVVEMPKRAA